MYRYANHKEVVREGKLKVQHNGQDPGCWRCKIASQFGGLYWEDIDVKREKSEK